MNTKLIIEMRDGKLSIKSPQPMPFDDILSMLLNSIKGATVQLINSVPEASRPAARGTVFDLLNLAFARLLEDIDPTCNTQTTLTAKAIREAEDRIVMEGRLADVVPGS